MRAISSCRTVALSYRGRPAFGQQSRKTGGTLHLWLPLAALVAIALLQPASAAPTKALPPMRVVRRVLIINDLGVVSSPGFAEVDQAVLAGLQKSPYQIELYEESLDFTLFPDRVSQDWFREEIIQKYSASKLDVIIAAGPESLKFIAKLYDKFPGTPIIFCLIWRKIPDQLRHVMPSTGVLAQLHPEETLNVALQLLPNTKHVVVIGGAGEFDEEWEAIAKQSFHNYESKLEFTYLFDLTMPALLARLKQLPSDTFVFHTSITRDAAGAHFVDSAQSIPMVAGAANAPVFVMDDVDLRAGTVGGDLVNWADDGCVAAEMAVRVFNGENPENIPLVTSNHAYMFDWRALKRWGMNDKNLPPGSIVLNRQPTVWEAYKRYIITGIALILLEALLIGGLVWQRAQLKGSEEKYRVIVEAASDAVIKMDENGGILLANPATARIFGYDPVELIGKPLTVLMPDYMRKLHEVGFSRYLATGQRHLNWQGTEVTALRRNGQEFPVEVSFGEMISNGQTVFTGFIRDISEKKRAEDELRRQKEVFQKIFENVPALIAFRGKDHELQLVNPECERALGWTLEEMRNPDLLSEFYPDPQYRQWVLGLMATSTGEGTDRKVRVRDGTVRDFAVAVVHLSDGTSISIGRDITERKRAEEILRKSERRQLEITKQLEAERARLIEAQAVAKVGSWEAELPSLELSWSEQTHRIFETDPSHFHPRRPDFVEFVHPEDRAKVDEGFQASFDKRGPSKVEYRIVMPDGRVKVLEEQWRVFHDDRGRPIRMIGTCRDVTEYRRADEALLEAQAHIARVTRMAALGELAAAIAHEVNQPLGAVVTNASASLRWLAGHPPNLEEAREAIDRTVREATRASDVIRRIRALLQKGPPQTERLDVNAVIREVLILADSELLKGGVTVRTELAADVPAVLGDRVQLQQVLLNLILNGVDAMGTITDRPRELLIQSARHPEGVLIEIHDSGVGVDPEQAGHIFDPFFTTKPQGIGMGLSIGRSIVEAHGGRLWFTRGSPHGIVFQLTVPKAA
jgi:PAS domain S-box-containing protein